MKTIWKFSLEPDARHNHFFMPKGATILSLQVQRGQPRMWAIVEDTNEVEKRSFRIVGTGHELPDDVEQASRRYVDDVDGLLEHYENFVGTFQIEAGDFVFHVFEVAS